MGAKGGDPLAGTDRSFAARLRVLRELDEQPINPWHRFVLVAIDGG
jgi:hypothetical protein